MEESLPYNERRKLSYPHRYSEGLAPRYPKISARFLPAGERGIDPHIEQVIEERVRCKPSCNEMSPRIMSGVLFR
jgi:type VI protein secretion system component VasA